MNRQHLSETLQKGIDLKTKPKGSLGMLESVAHQVGMIQQTISPVIHNPNIIVFAADHGIALTGSVNPYPQEVTSQMVKNFLNGGAAINVFCRQNNIGLTIVDAGINDNLEHLVAENFIHAKIGMGTGNYFEERAMSLDHAARCIAKGKEIACRIITERRSNCIGFGDMGIGNTSSASLIMSAITKIPIQDCVGRGTGSSDQQLKIKKAILMKVYAFHHLNEPGMSMMELISRAGGFEIAMMVGAYVQAHMQNAIIVVDGFIATAALMIALKLEPAILDNCIFAHTSGETGHRLMLRFLKARPLLELGLRLGEGTGAALAIPLIQSSLHFYNEMATFRSASVSNIEI